MDIRNRDQLLDAALCCVARLGDSTCAAFFAGLLED